MSPLGTTNSPSPNGVSLLQLSSLAVSSHSPSPYHTHGHQCFLQKHASQYIPSSCLKPFQLLPVILRMISEFFHMAHKAGYNPTTSIPNPSTHKHKRK